MDKKWIRKLKVLNKGLNWLAALAAVRLSVILHVIKCLHGALNKTPQWFYEIDTSQSTIVIFVIIRKKKSEPPAGIEATHDLPDTGRTL